MSELNSGLSRVDFTYIAVSLNNLRLEAFSVTSVKETVVSLVVVLWHWVGLVGWVVEVVDHFRVFLLADVLTK